MVVLGIDPGIARCGYGIIKKNGSTLKALDYGVITTSAKLPTEQRLKEICSILEELIKKYSPEEVALEKVFYFKNQKTIIIIGQVQGALMLTLVKRGYSVNRYTPLQVKQAVSMYGRATKTQIQIMVQKILNLKELPTPDDTADALAIAITHAHSVRNNKLQAPNNK